MRSIISILFISMFMSTTACASSSNDNFLRGLVSGSRGGNSVGPAVEFDSAIPQTWKDIREESISKFERDRRAILAMQGEFEVSFEFLEAFLMDTDKKKDTPYFSKATEIVKVIENREDFISLQHIIVMYFKMNGEVQGPVVVKHWRQDWEWEGRDRFLYQGSNKWNTNSVNGKENTGKWVWNVFQVDDSPRYSGVGEWNHLESASFFNSDMMSRPLPRREFSVRSDYNLLMGKETLIVTPNNWYHEQKAFKHEGDLKNGKFNGKLLSREVGQNTYKRIKNFDWSAGLKYWDKTQGYWSDVRAVWKELVKRESLELRGSVDGVKLFSKHFTQAEDDKVLAMPSKERQALIMKTISKYIK